MTDSAPSDDRIARRRVLTGAAALTAAAAAAARPGTAAADPPPDPGLAGFFDVVDHGADPTGAAPSNGAVEAILALPEFAASGGTVYFPPGTYLIETSIPSGGGVPVGLVVAVANAHLRGAGTGASRLLVRNVDGSGAGIGVVFNGASDCSLRHLSIEGESEGSGSDQHIDYAHGVVVASSTRWAIEDVDVKGFWHDGIEVILGSDGAITSSVIDAPHGDAVRVLGGSRVNVTDNHLSSGSDHAVYVTLETNYSGSTPTAPVEVTIEANTLSAPGTVVQIDAGTAVKVVDNTVRTTGSTDVPSVIGSPSLVQPDFRGNQLIEGHRLGWSDDVIYIPGQNCWAPGLDGELPDPVPTNPTNSYAGFTFPYLTEEEVDDLWTDAGLPAPGLPTPWAIDPATNPDTAFPVDDTGGPDPRIVTIAHVPASWSGFHVALTWVSMGGSGHRAPNDSLTQVRWRVTHQTLGLGVTTYMEQNPTVHHDQLAAPFFDESWGSSAGGRIPITHTIIRDGAGKPVVFEAPGIDTDVEGTLMFPKIAYLRVWRMLGMEAEGYDHPYGVLLAGLHLLRAG